MCRHDRNPAVAPSAGGDEDRIAEAIKNLQILNKLAASPRARLKSKSARLSHSQVIALVYGYPAKRLTFYTHTDALFATEVEWKNKQQRTNLAVRLSAIFPSTSRAPDDTGAHIIAASKLRFAQWELGK